MQQIVASSDIDPQLARSSVVDFSTGAATGNRLANTRRHLAATARAAFLLLLMFMALPLAAQDTQAPTVPTGLVATTLSSGEVKLSWNASTDNDSVKGYYVYLNNVAVGTTKGTWFNHCRLAPSTTYNYRVSAYDSVPNHSAWTSTPVSITTPASPAPSSLKFCATFEYATGPFSPFPGNPNWNSNPSNDGVWGVEQKYDPNGYARTTIVPLGREGGSGLRLHTDAGDNNVSGSLTSERNDVFLPPDTIGTMQGTDGTQGTEQWWAHSILIPNDFTFPPSGSWAVVSGFHDTRNQGGQGNVTTFVGTDGHLTLRGHAGPDVVNDATGNQYSYGADLATVTRNVWYDFVYHVKWSQDSDGYMQVWVNGELKLNHHGPTLYDGYAVFLKLADYHSAYGYAMSVNHDRVMRGTAWDAVALSELEGLVSITSPIAGSTISGNITFTATAYTSFNVVGVQFKYDGINFGQGEDTSSPYSANADTTLVSNGWHTITAVARDSDGNYTTSAPLTVYVSN